MAGRTDFTTEAGWENVWLICYTLVDDTYQSLEKHYGVWRRTAPIPLFSASKKKSVLAFISQAHSSKRLIVGSMVWLVSIVIAASLGSTVRFLTLNGSFCLGKFLW